MKDYSKIITTTKFLACNALVGISEGSKLDLNSKDRGNWTGGKIGIGELKGSKFGISAASYPDLDIANLDFSTATKIYKADYWDKIYGDDERMVPPIALISFDSAVNSGPIFAAKTLQSILGLAKDGQIGDITLNCIGKVLNSIGSTEFIAKLLAARLTHYLENPEWQEFKNGWEIRLFRLPMQAYALGQTLANIK